MWGGKYSLLLEHLTSLPLGVHDFTHSLYITEFVNLRTMFSGLITLPCLPVWISLHCFVMDLFCNSVAIVCVEACLRHDRQQQ